MFSIFRDQALRKQLEENGYVTLPFLEEASLVDLRNLFAEVKPKVKLEGFATTTTSPDLKLKQEMFARIAPHYQAKVDALFQDYKPLGASFLQKDPGKAGSLPLHQDWTVTDEDRFRTFTIWVPLEDCGLENGAIQMLPGSHRWTNLLRGPNLPIAIQDVAPMLSEGLVTLTLKVGEAVIFDHSILHTSLLNTSGRPRIALTYGLTHREAPLRFWYYYPGDARDRFEQIAVPDDFFLQYHQIGQRPVIGQSLGFYRQDLQPINVSEAKGMQSGNPIRRPIYRDLSAHDCLLQTPQYAITHDANWNRNLATEGYITFPLLDTDQVAHLQAFFASHQAEKVERFYASVHNADVDFRLLMDAELQRLLGPMLAEILDQAEALGGSFIAKPKGNAGILPPHADWNIVDERLWRSYNLWIPLVDTTVANGAIHLIPGSHNWLDYFRGPGIPNPFEPLKDAVWAVMKPLELKAGTALLYDHRLLHASPVNTTDKLRLACVMGIKPKAAAMRYYHGNEGLVREYAATASFYMQDNPEQGPKDLELLQVVTDQFPTISLPELQTWLGMEPEAESPVGEGEATAERSFFSTYTPSNIWREIKWRLGGKNKV